MTEPRMSTDLSYRQYARLPGIRASQLIELARSPAHLRAAGDDDEPTPAQQVGLYAHQCLLGGDDLLAADAAYDQRTKEGKARHLELVRQAGERRIIPFWPAQTGEAMAEVLHKRDPWGITLCAYTELVIEWREGELACKARIDACGRARTDTSGPEPWTGYRLYEYKTCRDARPAAFSRDVARYGYILQLAWYRRAMNAVGMQPQDVYIVAQENEYPYAHRGYRISETYMDWGRREVERLLALYRDCAERDVWPGYADEIEDLFPPAWLLGEEGDADES